MRETPYLPVALYEVVQLFGTLVAETILASAHVRAHKQAGHMDASDLIKETAKHLARRGPSTYGWWPECAPGPVVPPAATGPRHGRESRSDRRAPAACSAA